MTDTDDSILDLSDLVPERKQVRFVEDGPLWDMATPDDLTILERAQLWALHGRMDRLNRKEHLSRAESNKLRDMMNEAARIVIPSMPPDEFRRLTDFKKEAVVLGFMSAFGRTLRRLAEVTGGDEMVQALANAQASRT